MLRLSTTITLLLLVTTLTAQNKLRFEAKIAFSDFYLQQKTSENPDFMNYAEGNQGYFLDDAYLGFKTSFALNKRWQSSLDFNFWGTITPITGDLRFTRYSDNNIDWNFGISQIPFKIKSIEPYYSNISNQFTIQTQYYSGHTAFYAVSYFRTLYSGFNYRINKNRVNLYLTVNGGLAFSKKASRYIHFQKHQSNYIYADEYEIPMQPSIFLKPEAEIYCAIIDEPTFQLGLKLECNLFTTYKKLNYTVTHYEWTQNNSATTSPKLPNHYHHQLSAEAGIFIAIK